MLLDVEGVVMVASSSVVVASSSAGGSSYPERETFAEASKNCFQNCSTSGLDTEAIRTGEKTLEPSQTFFECSA